MYYIIRAKYSNVKSPLSVSHVPFSSTSKQRKCKLRTSAEIPVSAGIFQTGSVESEPPSRSHRFVIDNYCGFRWVNEAVHWGVLYENGNFQFLGCALVYNIFNTPLKQYIFCCLSGVGISYKILIWFCNEVERLICVIQSYARVDGLTCFSAISIL